MYFIATSQKGAQTQIDTAHSSTWLMTAREGFWLSGALITMKSGPNTSADVTLMLYEGSEASEALDQATLTPDEFCAQVASCGSFANREFTFEYGVQITQGRTYVAKLTSQATDAQNEAYFIKSTDFFVSDENGTRIVPQPIVTGALASPETGLPDVPSGDVAAPEPSACVLTGLGFALITFVSHWTRNPRRKVN